MQTYTERQQNKTQSVTNINGSLSTHDHGVERMELINVEFAQVLHAQARVLGVVCDGRLLHFLLQCVDITGRPARRLDDVLLCVSHSACRDSRQKYETRFATELARHQPHPGYGHQNNHRVSQNHTEIKNLVKSTHRTLLPIKHPCKQPSKPTLRESFRQAR